MTDEDIAALIEKAKDVAYWEGYRQGRKHFWQELQDRVEEMEPV